MLENWDNRGTSTTLAEIDGIPYNKGSKSGWTKKLQTRYNVPGTTPFLSAPEWIPDVAIPDAMFAININPLRQHKSFKRYTCLFFQNVCHSTLSACHNITPLFKSGDKSAVSNYRPTVSHY